jgi:(p)ppGpp synthase/HD superfamily hydrolase
MAFEDKRQSELLLLSGRFTSAIDYARVLHIERRKGTEIPYMAHLLGVASLVMGEAGQVPFAVTEEMVIAAVLHDAAEDHGGLARLKDIEHNFGAKVARMVEGLSDSLTEDADIKQPWLEGRSRRAAHLSGRQAVQREGDPRGLPGDWAGDLETLQTWQGRPDQVLR